MGFDQSEKQMLTSEGLVFMRLQRIGALSDTLYDYASTDWQKNAMNYYYAVTNFSVILYPHLTDEDIARIHALKVKYTAQYKVMKRPAAGNRTRFGMQDYINLNIDYSNDVLRVLIARLGSLGMYMESSVSAKAGELDNEPDYERYDGYEHVVDVHQQPEEEEPEEPEEDEDEDEDDDFGITIPDEWRPRG